MERSNFLRGFLCLVLLSLVSCGGTDFYAKDIKTEAINQDPGGVKFGTGDPGRDTDIPGGFYNDPTRDVERDTFLYDANKDKAPVDILFVVDNSGSMGNEQQALATNFNLFITDFVTTGMDFNMAITTTDMRPGYAGVPVPGSMSELTYAKYLADSAQFFSDFSSMITVGIAGSGEEKGLAGSKAFFEDQGNSFVRNDAFLTIIYVSDEEDQSTDSVESYVNYLKSLKADVSRVQAHSIVRTEQLEGGGGVTVGGARYIAASNGTNGSNEEITNDFSQTLSNISTDIITKIKNYVLKSVPIVKSIKVVVDGQLLENNEWTYNAQLNSIEFVNELSLGAEIKVFYYKQ